MKLRNLELSLPNGLHDAKIVSICRDLRTEFVDVHLELLVGLPDDEPARRNEVRQGVLRFKGAKIFIVEQPSVESSFFYPGPVNFVLTEDEAGSLAEEMLKKLQPGCHIYTFFIQDWLSSLKIAARDLEFTWS